MEEDEGLDEEAILQKALLLSTTEGAAQQTAKPQEAQ